MKAFRKFKSDESGAVTVDWVVLTAGAIGLGVVVTLSVANGTKTLATRIHDNTESMAEDL